MVLDVGKNLKSTQWIILDNFCFNTCLKKSLPGDARAQVLQEPVGASHADQGGKSGGAPMFLGPGGQEESNGTPHLTQAQSLAESQGGGSYSNIYKETCFCFNDPSMSQ